MPIPLMSIVNRTVVGIDRDGIVRFYQRGMPATSEILETMAAAPQLAHGRSIQARPMSNVNRSPATVAISNSPSAIVTRTGSP